MYFTVNLFYLYRFKDIKSCIGILKFEIDFDVYLFSLFWIIFKQWRKLNCSIFCEQRKQKGKWRNYEILFVDIILKFYLTFIWLKIKNNIVTELWFWKEKSRNFKLIFSYSNFRNRFTLEIKILSIEWTMKSILLTSNWEITKQINI